MKPHIAIINPQGEIPDSIHNLQNNPYRFEPHLLDNHAERLHPDIQGLFIYAKPESSETSFPIQAIRDGINREIPVLASQSGAHALNLAMGGDKPVPSPDHAADSHRSSTRNSVFLAIGAKTASTIGGSGWLTIPCNHPLAIQPHALADDLMTSCISQDRRVEAFESPGHSWRIGVQWDLANPEILPRGFDNLLLAFIERALETADERKTTSIQP